eukprot:scaffold1836_cov69-Cyclotella_meneghiniana.AAC.2
MYALGELERCQKTPPAIQAWSRGAGVTGDEGRKPKLTVVGEIQAEIVPTEVPPWFVCDCEAFARLANVL